ncbi:hypothetical protein BM1_00715 [Bipolaris maydis]|nr:hypothetical protein BM1_00715 [Bipolaris maydis]
MERCLAQIEISNDVSHEISQISPSTPCPDLAIKDYCIKHAAIFRELADLRRRGWENPRTMVILEYNVIERIMQMNLENLCHQRHHLPRNPPSLVSAWCLAASRPVFKRDCYARVCGISLPVSRGGHEMILPNWRSDPRIRVRFLDIIMLAAEMDVTNIPVEHPDATNFVAEHREKREAWRLLASQLVLALQCVKQDGKIVILLHKLEAWDTVLLPYTLGKFSSFQLFKPQKKPAIRSSFYVVAEQIQTQSSLFQASVTTWKEEWYVATFGSDVEYRDNRARFYGLVDRVLSDFGTELLELGQPIWEVQSAALRKASFVT